MTRVSLFNSPLLLGFEQFEQALDRISKTASDGYPPYNVEQVDDHRLRITLAVAGFGAGELEVQIQDNQLVIRGQQQDFWKSPYAADPARAANKRTDWDDGHPDGLVNYHVANTDGLHTSEGSAGGRPVIGRAWST